MLLPILLLASSAVALASPRVKGPQITPYGIPLPYQNQQQPSFPVPAQQGVGAPNKPAFEVVPDSGDSDSILIRVNSQNFDQFIAQSGVNLPYSQKYDSSNFQDNSVGVPSQTRVAQSAQFNAPSNPQPSNVQFTVSSNPETNVPSNTQFSDPSSVQFSVPSNPIQSAPSSQSDSRTNVQPDYEVQARHNTPQHRTYSAAFQGGGAGRKVTRQKQLLQTAIGQVLRNAPGNAQLIATQPVIPSLAQRLPDNYTLIRPNVVDTFRCNDRVYGYYADVDNDCQLFHVCLPMRQLYPANFTQDVTFQFSFICPEHTIFSQDAMVCAWKEQALDCEYAPDLYWINQNFFRKVPDASGTGLRYAHVNEPLP